MRGKVLTAAAVLSFALPVSAAPATASPVFTCAVPIHNTAPAVQPAFERAVNEWNRALTGSGLVFVDTPVNTNGTPGTVTVYAGDAHAMTTPATIGPATGLGHIGTDSTGGKVWIAESAVTGATALDLASQVAVLEHEIGHAFAIPHLYDNPHAIMGFGYSKTQIPVTPSVNADDIDLVMQASRDITDAYCPGGAISRPTVTVPNRGVIKPLTWVVHAVNRKGQTVAGSLDNVEVGVPLRTLTTREEIARICDANPGMCPPRVRKVRTLTVHVEDSYVVNPEWEAFHASGGRQA